MNKIINRVKNIKNIEYLFLSLILILGFVVRLYKINSPLADWHSWRQADTASVTRTYLQRGLNILYPKYHDISSIQTGYFNPQGYRFVELPIYNVIHLFLYKAHPKLTLEVWGRLLSVFSALVSSFFLFLIGRKFTGKWGGLLAAFFFCVIPYNIYFTRVILPEPLGQTFALISLWLIIKYIDTEKDSLLYFSGFFLALSLLIKPFTYFYVFPAIYLISKKYGMKNILNTPKLLIKFLIYSDLLLVPLFLWRGWIGKHPEGIPFFTWAFNGDHIRFRPAFWRWIFGERIGRLILGTWGLIPFILGAVFKKKNYFNLVFMAGALSYLFVVATASVRHDYYQIFIIPPISLLLAEGSLYLWNQAVFNKWLSRSILVFSILMMIGMGAYQVKEYYKINHPEIIAAGQAVDKLTPKDALVIAPYNGDTAFLYQTGRWGWPAVDDSFENIIKKGASYYVSVDLGSPDTKYVTAKYKTIAKTDQYIIVDLHESIKQ